MLQITRKCDSAVGIAKGSDSVNPIAARSQAWLIDALFELMREKPYVEITVTDIAQRAQLSRRTFYRNFATKDELISMHARRLVDEYVDRLLPADLSQTRAVALTYFEFWTDHAEFLRLLAASGMSSLVLQKFNEHIPMIFERSRSPKYAGVAQLRYALAFNAGGYFNLLFEWLRGGAKETPAEMADAVAAFDAE